MATYFLGVRTGKGKDSGNDYYVVRLLLQNNFSQWISKEFFIKPTTYGKLVKMQNLTVGSPILPVFDGSGDKPTLKRLTFDDENEAIVLVPDEDD